MTTDEVQINKENHLGDAIVGPKRVLIADDSEFMRVAYKRILETQEYYEVVALAVNGKDALDKAIRFSPDVALLDIRMPEMDGIEASYGMVKILPEIAIVIISAYDNPKFLAELLRSGLSRKAYILKNSLDDIEELIRTVDAVTHGQTVLDARMVQQLAQLYSHDPRWLAFGLTALEQDVLEFATEGHDDATIAGLLRLPTTEVKSALEMIYRKFDLDPMGDQPMGDLPTGDQSTGEKLEQIDRRIRAIHVFVKQIIFTVGQSEGAER